MRMPARTASNADLIAAGHFAAVGVAVDDETAGLETDMKAADQGLRASVGKRNQATDALIEARARRRVPRRRLTSWLRQVERHAKLAFQGKTDSYQSRRNRIET